MTYGSRPVTPRDALALVKPNIAFMALLTAAGGMSLAPGAFVLSHAVVLLIGTALIVGAANTLNMYLERDVDRRMARTKDRPLPAERMAPEFALAFGLAQAAIAVPILSFGLGPAGPLTGLLAVIAFVSYVLVYTPMKQRSHLALWVGSVPGAMPALMGWTSVTGHVDAGGLAVFAVLFFWQIPHFLAIATFRKSEYDAAGLKVLPVVKGDRVTRHHIVRWLAALLLSSFLLFPTGLGGTIYKIAAIVLGALFFGVGLLGLRASAGVRWARTLFLVSLVYVVGIFGALLAGG